MAYTSDVFLRTSRALPRGTHAHWLLRAALALVLVQQGLDKFPLSADAAAGFGLPFALWALAAVGEIGAGALLVVAGFLRGPLGNLLTRVAGAGLAVIVLGVLFVAYGGTPADWVIFNQFHLLLMAGGLFFALTGGRRSV